uniref:Uncharacterized protein n=1 Tax=Gopherus agassizii TaxID=38772 RepID=A0A452HW64_9SAUR
MFFKGFKGLSPFQLVVEVPLDSVLGPLIPSLDCLICRHKFSCHLYAYNLEIVVFSRPVSKLKSHNFFSPPAVGKTSLITRFMYDSFDNTYQVSGSPVNAFFYQNISNSFFIFLEELTFQEL